MEVKINKLISKYSTNGGIYNARYVIDVSFIRQEIPTCLQPDFQFWADDEYVSMSDILIGTSPAEEGRVRYYFNGSDRALRKLKSYLKREIKRCNINIIISIDRVRAVKKIKNVSEENIQLVRAKLPDQPWSKGIHKDIAKELGLSNGIVSSVIAILIADKVFKDQINGEIIG